MLFMSQTSTDPAPRGASAAGFRIATTAPLNCAHRLFYRPYSILQFPSAYTANGFDIWVSLHPDVDDAKRSSPGVKTKLHLITHSQVDIWNQILNKEALIRSVGLDPFDVLAVTDDKGSEVGI
jgi:hypothetical protein